MGRSQHPPSKGNKLEPLKPLVEEGLLIRDEGAATEPLLINKECGHPGEGVGLRLLTANNPGPMAGSDAALAGHAGT